MPSVMVFPKKPGSGGEMFENGNVVRESMPLNSMIIEGPQGPPEESATEENLKLRRAIRKLKLENSRMKLKFKELQGTVQKLVAASGQDLGIKTNATEADKEYDDIRYDYILVGGPKDPFSLRYEVNIKDANGITHKSAERYFWYKKAETFDDQDAMQKILELADYFEADKAHKAIKNVDEKKWEELKLAYWEEAQRYKLEQVRWIANLLIVSGTTYIALASSDKLIGTGWRKTREEGWMKSMWDGMNMGGKFLMNYRHELKQIHKWHGPQEQQEAENKYRELKQFIWRRDKSKSDGYGERRTYGSRVGVVSRRGGGSSGGRSGGYSSGRSRGSGGSRGGGGSRGYSSGNRQQQYSTEVWQNVAARPREMMNADFSSNAPSSVGPQVGPSLSAGYGTTSGGYYTAGGYSTQPENKSYNWYR